MISMYVNSFAVINMPNTVLPDIIKASVKLVQTISSLQQAFEDHKESLGSPERQKDLTKVYFEEFSRSVTWFLG